MLFRIFFSMFVGAVAFLYADVSSLAEIKQQWMKEKVENSLYLYKLKRDQYKNALVTLEDLYEQKQEFYKNKSTLLKISLSDEAFLDEQYELAKSSFQSSIDIMNGLIEKDKAGLLYKSELKIFESYLIDEYYELLILSTKLKKEFSQKDVLKQFRAKRYN